MIIAISELIDCWDVKPNGVLHVGAHMGEEASEYEYHTWLPVIWIEAQSNLVENLRSRLKHPPHTVIEAAIWEENDVTFNFKIASNSQSSSLLDFGSHQSSYPKITFDRETKVQTKRIDKIINTGEMPNFINLDIQGVELSAIKSLGNLLNDVDYIYTEVNRKEVYINCALIKELDEYLNERGFKRVVTRWYLFKGWGDALYVRKSSIKKMSTKKFLISRRNQFRFYWVQIQGGYLGLLKRRKSRQER